eukprot:GFUD01017285.1.p1 GENE.GFUD01017285.1~~GFUD01017285.1.p1  ORF type:complete len:344 (-),score=79.52 GFUD01017285.1:292-1323(-)
MTTENLLTTEKEKEMSKFCCTVCDDNFLLSEELTYHYMTHSLVELAHALTEVQARLEERETSCSCRKPSHAKTRPEHADINDKKISIPPSRNTQQSAQKTPSLPSNPSLSSRSPHPCHICDNVLSSRGALVKHLVTHKDKKPFQCDQCTMEFNQNRDLKTHIMQKHSMQRPHVCGICQKGFVHKFYLMEHMTYHTGERQFQCFHCGKRFQAQSGLTKHIKRHTTTKDFSCHLCPKAFAVKTDLNTHIRLVHEKPTSSKGIPAETINNISFELNYEHNVNSDSFEGATDENTNWSSQDTVEKKRYLDKEMEEWMVSQGVKIGGDRIARGVTYIPNVPKISEHIG